MDPESSSSKRPKHLLSSDIARHSYDGDDHDEDEQADQTESVPLLAASSSWTTAADTMFGRRSKPTAAVTGESVGAADSKTTTPPAYDSAANSSDTPRNLSVAPEELTGLSLYEKKCVLINHEMDRNGMGRYQWYIWFLCGFGYLLDLLWAQAFGLVLSPLQQELGFGNDQSGNISIAFSAGLTAGAAFWGILVDIIGRKWAFNLTCLISAAFGLGLGGCNTYTSFLVITAFVGFGIGGNIPIDTTICLEFLPQNRRFLLALLSIFQPIGVVITSAIAYGFIPNYSCTPNFSQKNALESCNTAPAGAPCCSRADNMGWRYLMFTIGALTLGVFLVRFVVFNFKESPKFLVFRNRDAEAVQVLEHIAHVNKRKCELRKEDLEALDRDEVANGGAGGTSTGGKAAKKVLGTAIIIAGSGAAQPSTWASVKKELIRYRLLFDGWQMTRLTLLIWLTYICDFWGFTLAGTYLPTIIAYKNGALELSLEFTYRSYMAIYTPGIVGVVIGTMMYRVPTVGRKWTMVISSGLMGASIFIFSAANSEASNIGLNAMEYFFQSMFNSVLYGWTPEVFPGPIRGTACGVASFWGRLFGIIAPIVGQSLVPKKGQFGDANRVLYLAGGVTLGCVLFTALLPSNRVLGKQSY